nr:hypothetical protein [Fulvivirga marina]
MRCHISKSIGEPIFFFDKAKGFSLKTIEVTDQLLHEIPDRFFPSLFQELIEKELEIRSFFRMVLFKPNCLKILALSTSGVESFNRTANGRGRLFAYNTGLNGCTTIDGMGILVIKVGYKALYF